MTDAFTEYIERKIAAATKKRDATRYSQTSGYREQCEQLRLWWCYESRREAYGDALLQYKLTRRESP